MSPRLFFVVILLCCASYASRARAGAPQSREIDLDRYFTGYDGCFVLLDVQANTITRYNAALCATRVPPCSTFKIPNSLIGLETGVIPNADTVVRWDGSPQRVKSWAADHTLRSAMANSVLWYYQALARGVGEERMARYVKAIGYGNQDLGGGIDKFWLNSTLKISADEQVEFLRKLHAGKLPFSKRTIDVVKEIMTLKKTDAYAYRGKTGSGGSFDRATLGWFVGSVTRGDKLYVFATNIEADDLASGKRARQITERILTDMKLLD